MENRYEFELIVDGSDGVFLGRMEPSTSTRYAMYVAYQGTTNCGGVKAAVISGWNI